MNLLIDTHIFIWCMTEPERIQQKTLTEMSKGNVEIYISIASIWEMLIKKSVGKLDVPDDLEQEILAHRFTVLPIKLNHTKKIVDLPMLHNDPFDRMLIAQAIEEKLTIVTRDKMIPKYDVKMLKA